MAIRFITQIWVFYRKIENSYFPYKNYIRDTSEIFSISSLVKISLMSLLCFFFVFRLVNFFCFRNTHIDIIKRKLHIGLNIWSLFSRGKKISFVCGTYSWKFFFHSKINFICSRRCVISSLCISFSQNHWTINIAEI